MEFYKFIVVGAGSSSYAAAARLSEDGSTYVLLLEADGWDWDPWSHILLGWGEILQGRLYDWDYFGKPEANAAGRAIECARGKVIGGSSSVNAMAYVRDYHTDFDRWADAGLDGWSCTDLLPYFKSQKSWKSGATECRGRDGSLSVRESRYVDLLVEAYIEASVAAGDPMAANYNVGQQEGFGRLKATIRSGKRHSAAGTYLRSSLNRKNLNVVAKTLVQRMVIERGCVTSVEYRVGGKLVTAVAEQEIILSTGVINTPQILMLFGISDPEQLRPLGINVTVPSAGLGSNLQDHLVAAASYSRKEPKPSVRNMRLDRVAIGLARAHVFGGFATDLPSGVMAFIKTELGLPAPDIQLLFHAGVLAAGPYMPPFRKAVVDASSCRAVLFLGVCGCTSPAQQAQAQDKTRGDQLVSAGFHKYIFDTFQRVARMNKLPHDRLVKVKPGGFAEYVYADPAGCNCIYAGDQAVYRRFRQEMAELRLTQSEYSNDADSNGAQPFEVQVW